MEQRSIRLSQRHIDTAESIAENGDADNPTEAFRDAIEYYGQELGYTNGEKRDTYLRNLLGRLAWAFVYFGVGIASALYFFPVEFRIAALVPFVAGLMCLLAERVLAAHEPRVTQSLRRLRGGEKA